MNNTTHHESGGARPLANPRHEQFAQAYAGEAHGNAAEAYRLAGYRPKNGDTAASCGERLLRNGEVLTRIKELRANLEAVLCFDRMELAAIRLSVARDESADASQRLAACRDLEKMMGWDKPDRLAVNHSGAVEHRWTVTNLKDGDGTADSARRLVEANN